jgi:hypothetical protein
LPSSPLSQNIFHPETPRKTRGESDILNLEGVKMKLSHQKLPLSLLLKK